jgi:hypothetical protein
LVAFFVASFVGQAIAMLPQDGWRQFWAATFENWQSEWLQLVAEAVLLLGLGHLIFRADKEQSDRIEAKLDELLGRRDG